jgi:hypothetical protein
MERHRTIAATPVRSASAAWNVVVKLLSDTLERSPSVPLGSVERGLAPLAGLAPALIAAGHFEVTPLTLTDDELHLTIAVVTGQKAFDIDENLNPVPGGAQGTDTWKLHIPSPASLAEAVAAAVAGSTHLCTDELRDKGAATPKKSAVAIGSPVDLDAVNRLRGGA